MPLTVNPPPLWIVCNDAVAYNAGSSLLTANTVYMMAFELYGIATVNSIGYRTGVTETGTTDGGIYDVNGNLLAHTGAITNVVTTTMKNALPSPLVIGPGLYYVALCPSLSTDNYSRISSAQGETLGHQRTATNTGTSGVLPTTTGVISSTLNSNTPAMIVLLSGGLT